MKLKPFSLLNHFTVPCAISQLLISSHGCLKADIVEPADTFATGDSSARVADCPKLIDPQRVELALLIGEHRVSTRLSGIHLSRSYVLGLSRMGKRLSIKNFLWIGRARTELTGVMTRNRGENAVIRAKRGVAAGARTL